MEEETNSVEASKSGWFTNLIGSAPDLIKGFNYKAQNNELELERLRTERALAESGRFSGGSVATAAKGINKTYIIIGVVVVAVIGYLILKK